MSKLRIFFIGLAAGISALLFSLFGRARDPKKVIVDAEKRDAKREAATEAIEAEVERYVKESKASESAPVVIPGTQDERDAELRKLGEIK